MFKYIPIFIVFVLVLSCSKKRIPSKIQTIKTLEYNRNNNPQDWQQLFTGLNDTSEQVELIRAAGKTKAVELLPIYRFVLHTQPNHSQLAPLYFAIGSTGSAEAESLLLKIPFPSSPPFLQKAYLNALALCATDNGYRFLLKRIQADNQNPALYSALGRILRKMPRHRFFPDSITEANSYFVSRSRDFNHLPQMVNAAVSFSDDARIHLLKALASCASADSARFLHILRSDSLAIPMLKSLFLSVLTKNTFWTTPFYALKIIPALHDSVLSAAALNRVHAKNPHLRLAACGAVVASEPKDLSVPFLLQELQTEKNEYLRGQLLLLLANIAPEVAYRIIMQDLDKGSDAYRASMLDALAATKLKPAIRTLHQFSAVTNARLANRAFDNLVNLKKVHRSDYNALLSSQSFSSVATALGWLKSQKQKLPAQKLLSVYKRFSSADAFEAQRAALEILSAISFKPDTSAQNILWNRAGHPFLQRSLKTFFPKTNWSGFKEFSYLQYLPSFLHPDSIPDYHTNPFVEIKTVRGNIILELFPKVAPLTVHHFLHLAQTGFYNNLTFHRVVPDFVIQGGDPQGTGWGSTAYLIPSEDNDTPFVRGSIGIATSGFDTGGCQFFICQSAQPHLNGNYTNFGIVRKGMFIVDQILPQDKILSISRIERP